MLYLSISRRRRAACAALSTRVLARSRAHAGAPHGRRRLAGAGGRRARALATTYKPIAGGRLEGGRLMPGVTPNNAKEKNEPPAAAFSKEKREPRTAPTTAVEGKGWQP